MRTYRSFVVASLALCLGGAALWLIPQARAEAQATMAKQLVKQLPSGVVGVELKSNVLAVKQGFKFVKGANNVVTVASVKAGGAGVDGSFSCTCVETTDEAGQSCDARISGDNLSCTKKTCSGHCELTVTIGATKTALMQFK